MKKCLSAFVSLCMMLTLFAGCSGGSDPTPTPEPTPAPLEPIHLSIGFDYHLGCVLYFIAEQAGYFEEYGLDVELLPFPSDSEGLAAVQADKLDCGSFGSTATFSLVAQGADNVKIFGGQMHEGSGIICQPEDAERFADFANYKDATIALVPMSTGDVVFRYGLLKAGLNLETDVTIRELDSVAAVLEAVKKGEVDCGGVWMPHLANAESQGLSVAMLSGEVITNHPCALMVTSNTAIVDKPEALIRLHKALIKAFDVFENDQDNAIRMIQEYLELSTEVLKADAYSRYSPNPEINVNAVRTFWEAINGIGYVSSDADINTYIDDSFYTAAMEQMLAENPDNAFFKEVARGGYGSNAE